MNASLKILRASALLLGLSLLASPITSAPPAPAGSPWNVPDGGSAHIATGPGTITVTNDGPDGVYLYSPGRRGRWLIVPHSSLSGNVPNGIDVWVRDARPGNFLGASGTVR